MPKEYPEHIDQLDHFYQQNLADIEILPPSDMWDRISAAYDEGASDRKKAVPFFNNNKKKIIGVVAVVLFMSTSTYLYVSNSTNYNEEENTAPIINNEPKADSSSIDINDREIDAKQSPNIKQSNSKPLHENINSGNNESHENSTSSTVEYSEKVTESSNEMIVNEPEIEIQKEEPKQEVTEKAPKKKVSFKDKYKKDYQDSTRNLFVPGK